MSNRRLQIPKGKARVISFVPSTENGRQIASTAVAADTPQEIELTAQLTPGFAFLYLFEVQVENGPIYAFEYQSLVGETADSIANNIRTIGEARILELVPQGSEPVIEISGALTVIHFETTANYDGVSFAVSQLGDFILPQAPAVSAIASLHYTVFDHRNHPITKGVATKNDANGYSIISLLAGPYYSLGRGYRVQCRWQVSGEANNDIHYTEIIYFDVVSAEWLPKLDLETLKIFHAPIGQRLKKQGQYFSPVKNANDVAAAQINNAMDLFDILISSYIRQDRLPSQISLIPDPQTFDRVLGYLTVSCTFRADGRMTDYLAWKTEAEALFENYVVIQYDKNQDGIADDEIKAPDRGDKNSSSIGGLGTGP